MHVWLPIRTMHHNCVGHSDGTCPPIVWNTVEGAAGYPDLHHGGARVLLPELDEQLGLSGEDGLPDVLQKLRHRMGHAAGALKEVGRNCVPRDCVCIFPLFGELHAKWHLKSVCQVEQAVLNTHTSTIYNFGHSHKNFFMTLLI